MTGDLTVDWAIVASADLDPGLQLPYLWERRGTAVVSAMPGGAAFIGALIEGLGGQPVNGPTLPPAALANPQFPEVARTFATWSSFPQSRGSAQGAWRMRQFLGQEPASAALGAEQPAPPDVLVIDDANLGFRGDSDRWQPLLDHLPGDAEIVVRMATPAGSGALWEELLRSRARQVTLVVSLGDLRREDAAVGQPLSWERTASEIAAAVRRRPDLVGVRRVVVGIGLSGALVIEDGLATLVYDPEHLEGDWEALHPGIPYGVGAAIVAAVASALAGGQPAGVTSAVASGLNLARALHRSGLTASPGSPACLPAPHEAHHDPTGVPFVSCAVPGESAWTLLGTQAAGDLRDVARTIVSGSSEFDISRIPVERMGAWVSVDRAEIESVRSVRNIVREYVGQAAPPRPLSIAVFGPPGCGKSFAIKQMAAEVGREGRRIETLEFNVSQFPGPEALSSALQRVRDCAVGGALPLVFWDEFDSARGGQELGWLAQFLAPMQDGSFLEASLVRPIGPAVFVFAGGTHATMESFKARSGQASSAKATDFLSRLRGFVDVLGPNPSHSDDQTFVVRRAFLLRQILQRRAPQLAQGHGVQVDPGVANAFLAVGRYLHGARSMEAIIEMSALSGRARFTRSALPAAHQLALHVDADEFLGLLELNPGG